MGEGVPSTQRNGGARVLTLSGIAVTFLFLLLLHDERRRQSINGGGDTTIKYVDVSMAGVLSCPIQSSCSHNQSLLSLSPIEKQPVRKRVMMMLLMMLLMMQQQQQ